jgi:catechol 2,3-dioxygenase-like lactoylglutathione lyase family enzyme
MSSADESPTMATRAPPPTMAEPSIAELGHFGLRCVDIERQLDFYTRVLGLIVTDHDPQLGIYFLSARPDVEHHELLLAGGRDVAPHGRLIQQISFRCERLADVIGFYRRLRGEGVRFDMIVSHGNAIGVYYFDPEGNRCEVYCRTGLPARQPFVELIDLDEDPDVLVEMVAQSVERFGAEGFMDPAYAAWTQKMAETTSLAGGVRAAPHDTSVIDELLAIEKQRCQAVSTNDRKVLEELLADDLLHTHVTGRTEDKATYLAALSGRPRRTSRGPLSVNVQGDVAVMAGQQTNSFESDDGGPDVLREAHALQVWVRREGRWQLLAFSASGRLAARPS